MGRRRVRAASASRAGGASSINDVLPPELLSLILHGQCVGGSVRRGNISDRHHTPTKVDTSWRTDPRTGRRYALSCDVERLWYDEEAVYADEMERRVRNPAATSKPWLNPGDAVPDATAVLPWRCDGSAHWMRRSGESRVLRTVDDGVYYVPRAWWFVLRAVCRLWRDVMDATSSDQTRNVVPYLPLELKAQDHTDCIRCRTACEKWIRLWARGNVVAASSVCVAAAARRARTPSGARKMAAWFGRAVAHINAGRYTRHRHVGHPWEDDTPADTPRRVELIAAMLCADVNALTHHVQCEALPHLCAHIEDIASSCISLDPYCDWPFALGLKHFLDPIARAGVRMETCRAALRMSDRVRRTWSRIEAKEVPGFTAWRPLCTMSGGDVEHLVLDKDYMDEVERHMYLAADTPEMTWVILARVYETAGRRTLQALMDNHMSLALWAKLGLPADMLAWMIRARDTAEVACPPPMPRRAAAMLHRHLSGQPIDARQLWARIGKHATTGDPLVPLRALERHGVGHYPHVALAGMLIAGRARDAVRLVRAHALPMASAASCDVDDDDDDDDNPSVSAALRMVARGGNGRPCPDNDGALLSFLDGCLGVCDDAHTKRARRALVGAIVDICRRPRSRTRYYEPRREKPGGQVPARPAWQPALALWLLCRWPRDVMALCDDGFLVSVALGLLAEDGQLDVFTDHDASAGIGPARSEPQAPSSQGQGSGRGTDGDGGLGGGGGGGSGEGKGHRRDASDAFRVLARVDTWVALVARHRPIGITPDLDLWASAVDCMASCARIPEDSWRADGMARALTRLHDALDDPRILGALIATADEWQRFVRPVPSAPRTDQNPLVHRSLERE